MNTRLFAFYLPQFHPIPENDIWWGKGFTEWTNVGKAKKYFRTHYQPRVPADLGYYDLRIPEARQAQAVMARKYGIEGFIYWHYWFGSGKRLLERPFNEVLQSGKPDFPFALAWANETWKGRSHGVTDGRILIEQQYPGEEDYVSHFYEIIPALQDPRYIKIENKPLFVIYKPMELPDVKHFIDLWNSLAAENNLNGFYFVAHHAGRGDYQWMTEEETFSQLLEYGFDAVNFVRIKGRIENGSRLDISMDKLKKRHLNRPRIYSYKKFYPYFTNLIDCHPRAIPSIISGWDHFPRNARGTILHNYTPAYFEKHLLQIHENIKNKTAENRIAFIKSWNEWAEGNYLEPDLRWGYDFLEKIKKYLVDCGLYTLP